MPEAGTVVGSATPSIWQSGCLIAPSLLSLDLCNLQRDVEAVAKAGLDAVHVDVIDGHFSPSMPIGIETIGQLRKRTELAFDVHVMTATHEYFVDALLDMGVQQLSFHLETERHADRMLRKIRQAGARAGIALKPGTTLHGLDYLLECCDSVLLMLTNPGYSGHASEAPASYTGRKIRDLRQCIERRGLPVTIAIDGRVSPAMVQELAPTTVDIFVAGSACISRHDVPGSLRALAQLQASVRARCRAQDGQAASTTRSD